LNYCSEDALALTTVSGLQYDGSGTGGPWTLAGSPYIVVGNVTVPLGQNLTVEPGVQVKFDGYYSIYVEGNLTAVGMETNRINITSNKTTPGPNDWRRIEVNSSGHIEIKYSDISYCGWGIFLNSSSNNKITDNHISFANWLGIGLNSSSSNTIMDNTLPDDELAGVFLDSSHDNTISRNNISGSVFGMYLSSSSNNTLTNNTITEDYEGIYIISSSENNTIGSNRISKNEWNGIYLISSSNNNIIDNDVSTNLRKGIRLDSSSNNTITGNDFSRNYDNVYLETSSGNHIINNEISPGISNGIFLYSSSNNIVADNDVSSSNFCGIKMESSSYNEITGNNVTSNSFSINLFASQKNRIFHNNFIDNLNRASDYMDNNIWNDTYPSGGNYWSSYSPTCQDRFSGASTPQSAGQPDGICDAKYEIDSDSIDYYPLKMRWGTPPDTTPPVANPGSNITVTVGNRVTFDGSASYDDSGVIENYTWIIEDEDGDTIATLYGVKPWHTFEAPGIYTVTLFVTDGAGLSDKKSITVTVTERQDEVPATGVIFLMIILIIIIVLSVIVYQKNRRMRERAPPPPPGWE
jgi:parallel beta-helix repeat protein